MSRLIVGAGLAPPVSPRHDRKLDDLPQRRRIRLPDFDYASAGAYFVTICTHRRSCVLGEVVDGNRVILSATGQLVQDLWSSLPDMVHGVNLDKFVVMPNHIHGIVMLSEGGAALPAIVGSFKSQSTRRWNFASERSSRPLWQRSYHDHVIRDEQALDRIREYVINNPAKWHIDRENPANFRARGDGPGKPGPYK